MECKTTNKRFNSVKHFRDRFNSKKYHFTEERHSSYSYFYVYGSDGNVLKIYNVIESMNFVKGCDLIVQSRKHLIENNVPLKCELPERPKLLYRDVDFENAKKYEGKKIVGIDIKNCYFETANKLGFIPSKTYYKAISDRSGYKDAMNYTIGSFGSGIYVTEYKDGKVLKDTEILPKCIRLKKYNRAVIKEVMDVAWGLRQLIGNDLLIWFTDCFYVPNDKAIIKKVENYLSCLGYLYRNFKIELQGVTQVNNYRYIVNLFDFKDVITKNYRFLKGNTGFNPDIYINQFLNTK